MLLHSQETDTGSKGGANSLYGLGLLSVNLIIDGTTNSAQDQLFRTHKVSGASMFVFQTHPKDDLYESFFFIDYAPLSLAQPVVE